jgi:energy-coupling factor transporter ATP-binding protein EcfA2
LSFCLEGFDPDSDEFHQRGTKKAVEVLRRCKSLVVPGSREMLVSGERLSSLIQLPVEPNTQIPVVRGFAYCSVPGSDTQLETVSFGQYCVGGLEPNALSGLQGIPASVHLPELTKHLLVVGATGSGKTTTVVSLLKSLKERSTSNVNVAILEGAKREYRDDRKIIGVDAEGHYDLMTDFLSINIFDHPSTIAPESHISQISALFEATLEMPAPLPSLMREAISHAYTSYHAETNKRLKQLHPIRFWLMKSLLKIIDECGYSGEIAHNIDAALRTRIRSLAQGACGRVLAGSHNWAQLAGKLTEQSIILELESIADSKSRSLVMALFVLFYRYALEGSSNALSNLLVLEEAHRIIGKAHPSRPDASEEYFSNLLSEIRSHGCGIVISDQSPSRLIDDAMRNTNTKIIMRLVSGQDIDAAVTGAGLPEEARSDIPRLKPFQALFIASDKLPGLIRIDSQPVFDARNRRNVDSKAVTPLDLMRSEHQIDEARAIAAMNFLRRWVKKPGKLERMLEERPFPLNEEFRENVMHRAREILDCKCDSVGSPYDVCKEHGDKLPFAALSASLALLEEEALTQ